jgi:hypothetical protein
MTFSYRDLTYIRASIQAYEGFLSEVNEDECSDDDRFSEIQDDRLYLNRLLALVNQEISDVEAAMPKLTPIKSRE